MGVLDLDLPPTNDIPRLQFKSSRPLPAKVYQTFIKPRPLTSTSLSARLSPPTRQPTTLTLHPKKGRPHPLYPNPNLIYQTTTRTKMPPKKGGKKGKKQDDDDEFWEKKAAALELQAKEAEEEERNAAKSSGGFGAFDMLDDDEEEGGLLVSETGVIKSDMSPES